ncbi:MAG: leucine-rich repeat protein [Clostridiales bacterium]|nr:leucine-rich repeat protein [Clostridiales bacterium]
MKRRIFVIVSAVILLLCCALLAACSDDVILNADKCISVTLINGEHYSVVGENKRTVERGEKVVFKVTLERGYKIIGAYGDDCDISDDTSFEQTVTFASVLYKATVRLETEEMSSVPFAIENNKQQGEVLVSSVLGQIEDGVYYAEDILTATATPKENYRFVCWSENNYLNDGGEFFDYSETIQLNDFESINTLYANYKSIVDTGNTIIYCLLDGREIEQDVTQLLAHHARANTYTAVDFRLLDVDCDSRYLAGYMTESGEYIGLGSRVAVSDQTATLLTPVWKNYTDASLFEINQGKISMKDSIHDLDEIVIPQKIGENTVEVISENAFAGCAASTIYIPDSVTTVENNAFKNCENLTDLYMSDNVLAISDKSFSGCKNFTTLHLNAFMKPRYSTEEPSVATNVYDRLAYHIDSDQQKLILLGGSSVKYGYCCYVVEDLFDQAGRKIDVYNLGYNATYSSYAQYQVLSEYLKADDIFLHAPEQFLGAWHGPSELSPLTNDYAVQLQSAYYIWRLCEGNWDFISSLTVNEYCNLFDKFAQFNADRKDLAERDYSGYFKQVVGPHESGLRITNEAAYPEWNKSEMNNRIWLNFGLYDLVEKARDKMYAPLVERGVNVYVTFPPIKYDEIINEFGGSIDKAIEEVTYFSNQVKQILSPVDLTVLRTQSDYIYDGIHFVEHDMHLGDPFRNTHTENVISTLIQTMKSEGKL